MSSDTAKKIFPMSVRFTGIPVSLQKENFGQRSSHKDNIELLESIVKWPFVSSQLTGWLPLGKECNPQQHKLNIWRRLFYTPSTASLLSFPSVSTFAYILVSFCLGVGYLLSPHYFQALSSQQNLQITSTLYFTLDATSAVILITFHVGLRVFIVRTTPQFANFWSSLHELWHATMGYLENCTSQGSKRTSILQTFISEKTKKFRKLIVGYAVISVYILGMDGYIGLASLAKSVEIGQKTKLLFFSSQLIGCFIRMTGFFSLLIIELVLDIIAFCFEVVALLDVSKAENSSKLIRIQLHNTLEKFDGKIHRRRVTIQKSIEQYEHIESVLVELQVMLNSRVILEIAFIVIQTVNRVKILMEITRNIGIYDPSTIVLGYCCGLILLFTQWGSLYRLVSTSSTISKHAICILSQIARENIQPSLSNRYEESIIRLQNVTNAFIMRTCLIDIHHTNLFPLTVTSLATIIAAICTYTWIMELNR